MSENVMSVGWVVPLQKRLTNKEREKFEDILYDQGSNIYFNIEGTLAYSDVRESEYGLFFDGQVSVEPHSFASLAQFGILVKNEMSRSYRCLWYNGVDSDMSMLNLDDFLILTSQKELVFKTRYNIEKKPW